jgi:thymidine phosphorylase
MLFTDVIREKRDGGELSDEQIQFFVDGLADESLPAEQVSSLAMAIFLNSMSFDEAAKLTMAMAASGTVLEWDSQDYGGPIVDKHSTGGVGDKVSFMLAPILAACGCHVPMISGRGLGHTGGTTDKVEAIPGYNATPDLETFRKVVQNVGCAIIGQTPELAPADRRFYSIRDVTGTVESVPLITASILSKKIAAGLQGLVMDVKVGSGAFMDTMGKARELANSIIGTAARAGLKTHAVITDMNEVLGTTAGNALEIEESVLYLRNEVRESRLDEVVIALCAEMLLVAEVETDRDLAAKRCNEVIANGHAARNLPVWSKRWVVRPIFWRIMKPICPKQTSSARSMPAGLCVPSIHAPLVTRSSSSFSGVASTGTELDENTPLAVIHAASEDDAAVAESNLLAAVSVGQKAPADRPVVCEILTG